MQLKQEKAKSKATVTLLLELLNEKIPSRRKLREAHSKVSKGQ